MPTADAPTLIVFIIYLAILVSVGIAVYFRTRNLNDYVLGSRSLPAPVAALSAGASDMSGWLMLGLPGAVYAGGLGATWIALGLAIGTYTSWLVVAPRLRAYTERAQDSVSLSSYFERRFEDKTRLLRVISAVIIIVFFTVYVSSGFVAAGLLFNQAFGLDGTVAITLAFLFVMIYTALGGFLADSFNDVIQGTLMFLALMFLPIVGLVAVGGFGALTADINTRAPELLNMGNEASYDLGTWGPGSSLGVVAIVSGLAWGLGYFGQPHVLARYMGIRRVSDVPTARRINATWTAVSLLGACVVALLGVVLIEQPLEDPEQVFLVLAHQLTNPWVAALLMAALLGAVMSTADSQLILVSTALTEDFYRGFLKRDAGGRSLLWIGRGVVITVAIFAFLLALRGGTVLDIVEYAWAGFGASFGPVIIASLYWSRMTWTGALGGMVTGAVSVLVWPVLDENVLGTGLYEMVPGFILAGLAIVACNSLGRRPEREWVGASGGSDGGGEELAGVDR